VVAGVGIQGLFRAYPESVPRISGVAVSAPALVLTLGLSMATAFLFTFTSVGPRLRNLVGALKESGSVASSTSGRRRALVTAEIALAVMLVVGAGLLIRTVYNLTAVDAGFDRSRLVTFSMTLPMATSEPDTRAQSYQRVLDGLRAVPGVQRAAVMSGLPPNRAPEAIGTVIENYVNAVGRPVEVVDYYQFVKGNYFETMHIPIISGRGFEPTDAASAGNVVIVNETLARKIWKDQNPIGRRIRPNLAGTIGANGNPWHTVIGVAKDVKQRGVDQPAGTELYVSLDQHGISPATMNVIFRTTLPPSALTGTLERLVREVDPSVPVVRLRDMDAVFAESIRRPRLLAVLLGAFAGLALLLAAVGTYGVLAYMVAERRREIGIRMALGAARSQVLTHILGQGIWLTAMGVAAGLAGSLALGSLFASLLFGVQPSDAATLATVLTVIAAVALISSTIPAWRASRVDPNIALRSE
jgi:predicted permease